MSFPVCTVNFPISFVKRFVTCHLQEHSNNHAVYIVVQRKSSHLLYINFTMNKIAIFGDSYEARLRYSEYADLFMPVPTVRCLEKGGLTSEQVQDHDEWRRKDWQSTHVFSMWGKQLHFKNDTTGALKADKSPHPPAFPS